MKNPKQFCYYCNQLADFKRQNIVRCFSCPMVCHYECSSLDCCDRIPKLKLKKTKTGRWKMGGKNEPTQCNLIKCSDRIPKLKLKKTKKGSWKVWRKNQRGVTDVQCSYTCNVVCSLKETPLNTIVTNSKGGEKKKFDQGSDIKHTFGG